MALESDFEIFRVNKQLCEFSKNGNLLAIAFQKNLTIKNVPNLNLFCTITFSDIIEYIDWSPNNSYIICANITNGIIQVFSLMYPTWKYKLTVGSNGFESVTWSPDNCHVLTTSDFRIQITIWPLLNNNVYHINKLKSTNCASVFSPDGKYLAVIISDDGNDYIELYKTQEWKLSREFHES